MKDLEILDTLIADTENNKMVWKKAERPNLGFLSIYQIWKGEKKLTDRKKLLILLKYDVDSKSFCEMRFFYIDLKYKTRDLIKSIKPGILSFYIHGRIKRLIKILEEKKEILGPNLPASPLLVKFDINDYVKLIGIVDGVIVNGLKGRIKNIASGELQNILTPAFKLTSYFGEIYQVKTEIGEYWVSSYNLVRGFEEVIY